MDPIFILPRQSGKTAWVQRTLVDQLSSILQSKSKDYIYIPDEDGIHTTTDKLYQEKENIHRVDSFYSESKSEYRPDRLYDENYNPLKKYEMAGMPVKDILNYFVRGIDDVASCFKF